MLQISLPQYCCFSYYNIDGLVSFENDKLVTNNTSSSLSTINEENIEETSTTLNASVSTTGRMKSSAGINDIDFEVSLH